MVYHATQTCQIVCVYDDKALVIMDWYGLISTGTRYFPEIQFTLGIT